MGRIMLFYGHGAVLFILFLLTRRWIRCWHGYSRMALFATSKGMKVLDFKE
jgi:hypothetical protein